jgi:hypothetical protein
MSMDKSRLQEEIAKVAYGLFERRGRVPGYDVQDWLDAERIVMSRREAANERGVAPDTARKKTAGAPKAEKTAVKPAAPKGRKTAGRKKER